MYGTIFCLHAKPGQERAIRQLFAVWDRERALRVEGFQARCLFKPDQQQDKMAPARYGFSLQQVVNKQEVTLLRFLDILPLAGLRMEKRARVLLMGVVWCPMILSEKTQEDEDPMARRVRGNLPKRSSV